MNAMGLQVTVTDELRRSRYVFVGDENDAVIRVGKYFGVLIVQNFMQCLVERNSKQFIPSTRYGITGGIVFGVFFSARSSLCRRKMQ